MRKRTLASVFALACMFIGQGFLFLFPAASAFGQYTYPPAMMGISPFNGSGSTWNGYINGWDYYGADSVQYLGLQFGSSAVNSCSPIWQPYNNFVGLLNDAGTGYTWAAAGTNTVIENSQCSLNANSAYTLKSGGYATGYAAITFKPSFAGSRAMWGIVTDGPHGLNSGWIPADTWNPPGIWVVPAPVIPTTTLTSPAPGGSGNSQLFTFTTDYKGTTGGHTQFGLTPINSFNATGGCWVYVYQDSNAALLLNDAGNGWIPIVGAGAENSQCYVGSVAIGTSGTVKNYSFAPTFKAAFAGTRYLWGYSGTGSLTNGGVYFGTWTIPMPTDNIRVTTSESRNPPPPGEPLYPNLTIALGGSVPGQLKVFNNNDPIQIRVRFAPPLTKVWAQRRFLRYSDSVWLNDWNCDGPPITGISGHETTGACYLGTTDANGFFEWNSHILPTLSGLITFTIYLGEQAFSPDGPYNTWGPMNEDNYVGSLVYWVIGTLGLPQPPTDW